MALITYEKRNCKSGRIVFAIVGIINGEKFDIDYYRTKAAAIRNLPKYTEYINNKLHEKLQTA